MDRTPQASGEQAYLPRLRENGLPPRLRENGPNPPNPPSLRGKGGGTPCAVATREYILLRRRGAAREEVRQPPSILRPRPPWQGSLRPYGRPCDKSGSGAICRFLTVVAPTTTGGADVLDPSRNRGDERVGSGGPFGERVAEREDVRLIGV